MRITFSIDSVFENKLDESDNAEDWDTYHLIRESLKRGHEVNVVKTNEVIPEGGFNKEIRINKNLKIYEGFTIPDVFFVRGYGMLEGKETFDNFVETLGKIENKVPFFVNGYKSTLFSRKDRQKSLPLPFIPSYEINSISDIRNLLLENTEGLILKPVYGLQGKGIEFVKDKKSLDTLLLSGNLTEEAIQSDYLAEKFIPDQREVRHIYLFGNHVGSRIAEKIGPPGREVLGYRYLNTTPNENQLEISKKAIDLTGIKYGCIDFRGNYVLEVNGSGTQTFYRNQVGRGKVFLDLNSKIMDEVEKRVN